MPVTEDRLVTSLPDSDIIAGNHYDKYGSKNPIARALMNGFFTNLHQLVDASGETVAHEIGCGEGHVGRQLAAKGLKIRGTDFSPEIIEVARTGEETTATFDVASVYDLEAARDSAPLILCCEVMEHLEEPERAMEVIASLEFNKLILSVPREPLWRMMNMARGKYWGDFGNTPGHLQNWSRREFLKLVSRFFRVDEIRSPLPWTMVSCSKK